MPLTYQFLIAKDFVDYTFDSSDTEDGSFPWSDVAKIDEQFRVGKSVGTATELVIFDMGSAQALTLLALYNINSGSYRIKGNNISDFTSPAYDSGVITANKDKLTLRYKSLVNPQDYGAFNYQFVGIEFPAGSPLDGQSAWQIGSMALSVSDELLLDNTNWGLSITPFKPAETVTLLSGGDQSINRGERRVRIEMSMLKRRTSAYFDQVAKFFLTLDKPKCLLLGFNGIFVEGGSANEEYFYLLNLLSGSDPSYVLQNRVLANVNSLSFKEVR